jgi:hypothetical protein
VDQKRRRACASRLATQQEQSKVVDGAGDRTGPTRGGFGAAEFARYVIASAGRKFALQSLLPSNNVVYKRVLAWSNQ